MPAMPVPLPALPPLTGWWQWRQYCHTPFETVALGWTGHNVYLWMPDRCYRFTAVWLNAADVTRH
jgi:hypothetical protein